MVTDVERFTDRMPDLFLARCRVEALEQAVESSRTALEATQAGFDVGTRTIVDVLNSQFNLYRAITLFYQARYDYLMNVLRLKQAAGTLQIQDLEEIVLRAQDGTPVLLRDEPTGSMDNSSEERIRRVSESASGFVYYVSFKGVTGANRLDVDAVAHVVGRQRFLDLGDQPIAGPRGGSGSPGYPRDRPGWLPGTRSPGRWSRPR